jgi:hypothetical protein
MIANKTTLAVFAGFYQSKSCKPASLLVWQAEQQVVKVRLPLGCCRFNRCDRCQSTAVTAKRCQPVHDERAVGFKCLLKSYQMIEVQFLHHPSQGGFIGGCPNIRNRHEIYFITAGCKARAFNLNTVEMVVIGSRGEGNDNCLTRDRISEGGFGDGNLTREGIFLPFPLVSFPSDLGEALPVKGASQNEQRSEPLIRWSPQVCFVARGKGFVFS